MFGDLNAFGIGQSETGRSDRLRGKCPRIHGRARRCRPCCLVFRIDILVHRQRFRVGRTGVVGRRIHAGPDGRNPAVRRKSNAVALLNFNAVRLDSDAFDYEVVLHKGAGLVGGFCLCAEEELFSPPPEPSAPARWPAAVHFRIRRIGAATRLTNAGGALPEAFRFARSRTMVLLMKCRS